MSTITYLDLVKDNDFRRFVQERLRSESGNRSYCFPEEFPLLYKYKPITQYSIDDIVNNRITLSSVGDFNDIFDGAIHSYGTEESINESIEMKKKEMHNLFIKAGMDYMGDNLDNLFLPSKERYIEESRMNFRILDYIGTYVFCMSECDSSTLMWSHYANSNQGMCIGYDFNSLPSDNLVRKMIFPILYTNTPCGLLDLLEDEKQKIYKYPIDAATLCASLNKAQVWNYEKEWRMVYIASALPYHERRMPFNAIVKPICINFGYHFIKPLFCYNDTNTEERDAARENLDYINTLLDYIDKNNIKTNIMIPEIGRYNLIPRSISLESLRRFIYRYFVNNGFHEMKYYYVIHDDLMDILEEGK